MSVTLIDLTFHLLGCFKKRASKPLWHLVLLLLVLYWSNSTRDEVGGRVLISVVDGQPTTHWYHYDGGFCFAGNFMMDCISLFFITNFTKVDWTTPLRLVTATRPTPCASSHSKTECHVTK
mmetsp:Transcript_52479/g.87263  ORF Transcript_52479/g.87263 Transcript_52479/m.87263 type:complete len:121 (+) Transcript_52479:302-664(+)